MTSSERSAQDLKRSLELLWGTPEEPTRGPKPGLSVERIVRAAVEIADAEGLAALSMRRIAGALGVGAMSLYRYVPGKAELVDLMADTVFGEDVGAGPADGDWRARLEAAGRAQWAMYHRHRWMLHIAQGRPMMGPNAITATEFALRIVDGLGLDGREMLDVVLTLSSFVSGLARSSVEASQAAAETGISDEQWWAAQSPYVETVFRDGTAPILAMAAEAGAFDSSEDRSFEFGLERILDGIAGLVASRAGRPEG